MEPMFHLSHGKLLSLIVIGIVGYCHLCSASPTRGTDVTNDSERLISMNKKVDAIDKKLGSLLGESDGHSLLIQIDRKLDIINEKLDSLTDGDESLVTLNGSNDRQDIPVALHKQEVQKTEQEQKEFPYYQCVNLISVERNSTEDGNRFTLRLRKNTENISYLYNDDSVITRTPDSIIEEDGEVWAVSFTAKKKAKNVHVPVWFQISDKVDRDPGSYIDGRHTIHFRLNNPEGSYDFQQMDPLPELHVDPPRAVIYEWGQDFNVTAFVPLNNIKERVDYISGSFDGIDLSNGEMYMVMNREAMFHELSVESDVNRTKKSLTVLTSSKPVSGYLHFSISLFLEGPVVPWVQISRMIAVRPSNQSTILPPNYLGIFNTPHTGESENGHVLEECKAGEECDIYCYGVGFPISDINVVKMLPDGNFTSVPSAIKQQIPGGNDAMRVISWKSQAENDPGNSDGIITYQCSVSDDTSGKAVSKLMDVMLLLEDGIDEEMSNVTVSEEYMEPYIKYLTLNCAVYGRPIPEVTFMDGSSSIFSVDNYVDDAVVITGQNRAVATKTFLIDLDQLSYYGYELHEVDELPSCMIFSKTKGEYLTHTFEIPDLGL